MIECTRCRTTLGPEVLGAGRTTCPSCRTALRVDPFPALLKPPPSADKPESAALSDEASCFYHPQKKAAAVCESCGRFLCSLCDLDFEGGHICPQCLERGRRAHKLENLETQRSVYDRAALYTAFLPLFVYPVTLITAPVTLFLVFRALRAPGSLVHRRWPRLLLATVVALLQLAVWTAFFVSLIE